MYRNIKSFAKTILILLAVVAGSLLISAQGAHAQEICYPPGGMGPPSQEACDTPGASQPIDPGASSTSSGSRTIDRLLQGAIDLMAAVTGIIIVLSIIIGAIQYMTARDNSSQVAAAKNRIFMSVLSLILFIFAYTILQWLVPGGIF